jgi:hypothetical protein
MVNLSLYIPKDLETKLRKRALALKVAPGLYVQQVVRKDLESSAQFSKRFEELSGSWEDSRSASELIRDIKANRSLAAKRAVLK